MSYASYDIKCHIMTNDAVMRWLTLPTNSWPANLPGNCHQCGARQGGAVRLCTSCLGGNHSRAWALKLRFLWVLLFSTDYQHIVQQFYGFCCSVQITNKSCRLGHNLHFMCILDEFLSLETCRL